MTDEQRELKEHFLEPETRGGTFVCAELKAAWKVMLDILEEFIRICGKYDLKYVMEGGSLLGAMRHKGFIPWDDDVDVAMPRKDYDQLIKVLPKELPPYYFAQTSVSDVGFHIPHLMIRDSRTTGIDPNHVKWKKRFNMGIRIDVIPLDGMPSSKLVRSLIRSYVQYVMDAIPKKPPEQSPKRWTFKVKSFLGRVVLAVIGRRGVYFLRELPFRLLPMERHGYCGSLCARNFWHPHSIRKTAWLSECMEVRFEYLNVSVPKAYDEVLTQQYKDWRTPIHAKSYHSDLVIDVNKDYKSTLIETIRVQGGGFRLTRTLAPMLSEPLTQVF